MSHENLDVHTIIIVCDSCLSVAKRRRGGGKDWLWFITTTTQLRHKKSWRNFATKRLRNTLSTPKMNRSTLASKSEAKRFTWQRLMARYTLENEGMLTTLQPTRHREKHPSQAPLSLATTSRNNKNRVPKIEMWRHVTACEHNVFSFESFISIQDAPPARLGFLACF